MRRIHVVFFLLTIFYLFPIAVCTAANCGIDSKTIDTYSVGNFMWSHQVQSNCSASSAEIELVIKVWTFNDYGVLDLFCSNTTTFDYGSVTTAQSKPGFIRRITRTTTPDSGTYYTITSTLNATQRGWLNDNGVIYFALIGNPYGMYGWPAQFDLSTSVLDTGIILPAISVSPTALSNGITVGETAVNQSFELWNSGASTLNYTISDNASWLSCSPAIGSSTGEHDIITVTYNVASLAAGAYSATITISDASAGNSPKTVPVSLTVTGVTPGISISPASFQTMLFSLPFNSPGTNPMGLAFDGTYLWNADYTDDKLYKIDRSGNIIASINSPGTHPRGLAFDGIYLWNTDSTQNKIYKLDLSGNIINSFPSPGTDPFGLMFDGTYLWNSDYTTDRIYKLDLSGNIIDSFASPGSNPMDLAFDGTFIWNVDSTTDMLYKLDLSGNIIASCATPGIYPSGLAFDGTNFWHADNYADRIYKLDISGRTIDYFKTPGTNPSGLTFDGTFFWHSDSTTDRIYRLDLLGNILDSFPSPGTTPGDLAFDGVFLWHADSTTDKIYKLDMSGNIIDFFSSPGTYPSGMAFDGINLWHADYYADRIYKLDMAGNVLDSFKSPGSAPMSLAFDGIYLWNSDSATNKIYKMDTSGNILAEFSSFGSDPMGLAFDGMNFWLADSSADMIRKFYQDPGPVEAGSSKTRTFRIISAGDADLETGGLYITGPDASNYSIQNDTCSGQTITPGGQCTVEIVFSPLSNGEKKADLEIPSNDADTPILVVKLDSQAVTFKADIDKDGDVDGKDLLEFALNFNPSVLSEFALKFGR
jgi:streptogramin lyase